MNKDRLITDLWRELDEAEEEIEYNVRRKEDLKEEFEYLKLELKEAKKTSDHYSDQCSFLSRKKDELETNLGKLASELEDSRERNLYSEHNTQKLVAENKILIEQVMI